MTLFNAASVADIRTALDDPSVTVISVQPGDYTVADRDEFQGFVIDRDIEIVSAVEGDRANFHAGTDFRKGLFLVESGASATFDGIGFFGTRTLFGNSQERNEAAIRHEGDALTVRNSHFSGNGNAILGSDVDNGDGKHLVVEDSVFVDNGSSSQEHHIYFIGDSVDVSGSSFTNANRGHAIKTVVSDFTRVTNNIIDDGDGATNHAINVTGGGDLLVSGNQIIKSASADNPYVVFYIPQRGHDSGSVVIDGNTIHTDWDGSTGGTLLLGNFSSTVAQLSNNTLTGSFATNLVYGIADDQGSTVNGAALSGQLWRANTITLTDQGDTYADDGTANSRLYSSRLLQSVDGGDGNDYLTAPHDDIDVNVFFGGAGNDFIDGGGGVDYLYGGDGDDVILTGTSSSSSPVDFASGGDGDDWIVSGSDTPTGSSSAFLVGGAGDDFIDGTRSYAGSFMGDGGDDVILGARYRDWLNGGMGDDFLFGGLQRDVIEGGEGTDTAIYLGDYGVDLTVNLGSRPGDLKIASLSGFNDEIGSSGSETTIGVEYIQFGNGVFDAATFEFTAGAARIDMADILNRGMPTPEGFRAVSTMTETTDDGTVIETDFSENTRLAMRVIETDGDTRTTTYHANGARDSLTLLDGSDSRSWTTYASTYDAATGGIVGQQVLYDNGDIGTTGYVDGIRASTLVTETDGDMRTVLYDAEGRRESVVFVDGSDTRSWANYTNTYDTATGRIDTRELLLDNGNTQSIGYIDGTRSSVIVTETDGDTRTTLYDADGARDSITFLDGGDTRIWTSHTSTYDAETGRIDTREVLYDNGNVQRIDYADGIRSSVVLTETDGDTRTTLYDADGTRTSVTFVDGSDTRSWTSFTSAYDGNGDFIDRTFVQDEI